MAERKHVLVPTDGSKAARESIEWVHETYPDAQVTALTVLDVAGRTQASQPDGAVAHGAVANDHAWSRRCLEKAESVAAERGIDLRTAVEVGRPARTIVEFAERNDVDQIVMGTHGRTGISRLLFGSVAEGVVRRSPVAVTVIS